MFPNISGRFAWIFFGTFQGKKIFDESSRHDVVEIARVPFHASFQNLYQEKTCNSALERNHLSNDTIDSDLRLGKYVGLRTYHHHIVGFVCLFVCVCVCVCVCVRACLCVCVGWRARINFIFMESNPCGNEKFCTRHSQTTSCSDEKNIFTRLQMERVALITHTYLTTRLKKWQCYNFILLVGFHGVE